MPLYQVVTYFASLQTGEFTFRAIILGLLLSVVLGAANTYLGLYAGLTVSASIPAAVLSMFILRKILRSGTILENNIVQSMASAGESLAAGVIFTIPALLISGNWHEFQFWPTTLVAFCGGMLGILFLIPFRKPFISKQQDPTLSKDLIYPEGEACAQVLRSGESSQARSIFSGMSIGIIYKLVSGLWLKSSAYFALPVLPSGRRVAYMGLDFSAALTAVGFIVGLRIAFLVFLGGLITWAVVLPLFAPVNPATSLERQVYSFWSSHGRFAGVGAMLIGTVESLLLASAAFRSFSAGSWITRLKSAWSNRNRRSNEEREDLPGYVIVSFLLFVSAVAFFLVSQMTGWLAIPLVLWILALSLPVVAVAAYLVGLVGSSNSPVSGITLSVLLLTGLLLWPFVDGQQGILALLLVAGMICCAAATAGDIAQDLRTGSLVGARPARQQMAEILGVAISAPFFALVLQLLHETYGIGDNGLLKAPQATLFASLAGSIFSDAPLPVFMIAVGSLLGGVLFFWNRYGSFRIPIMPVAVGMYLPLSVSTPLLLGGLLFWIYNRFSREGSLLAGLKKEHQPAVAESNVSAPAEKVLPSTEQEQSERRAARAGEGSEEEHGDLTDNEAGGSDQGVNQHSPRSPEPTADPIPDQSPNAGMSGGIEETTPSEPARIQPSDSIQPPKPEKAKSRFQSWFGDPLLYSSGLIAGEALGGILLALLLLSGISLSASWSAFALFLIVLLPLLPLSSLIKRRAKGKV